MPTDGTVLRHILCRSNADTSTSLLHCNWCCWNSMVWYSRI